VDGIVLPVKNVWIGENGIVDHVMNVSNSLIYLSGYVFYIHFCLGTYGVSLPCEGCGGKSEISASC
jgi:hypothetical protein